MSGSTKYTSMAEWLMEILEVPETVTRLNKKHEENKKVLKMTKKYQITLPQFMYSYFLPQEMVMAGSNQVLEVTKYQVRMHKTTNTSIPL